MKTVWKGVATAVMLAALAACSGSDPGGAEPSDPGVSESPSDSTDATPAPERVVRVELVVIGRSQGACTENCHWVNVHVSGFEPNSRQAADLALNGDTDWCEGARPCDDPRQFNVGPDGSGSLERYFYNGLPGTVSATVDGVVGEATMPGA